MMQPHKTHTSSPMKAVLKVRETNSVKLSLEPAKPELLEGLKRKVSRNNLLKRKKSRPAFKKL
jgi:hypothetical protein